VWLETPKNPACDIQGNQMLFVPLKWLTGAVLCESDVTTQLPSSLFLAPRSPPDIAEFCKKAHAVGAVVVVDATFAPPPVQFTFKLGTLLYLLRLLFFFFTSLLDRFHRP